MGEGGQDHGQLPIDTTWDAANVIYDIGKIGVGYATGNTAMMVDGSKDLAMDTGALLIPYVPAGASKVLKVGIKYGDEAAESVKAFDKANDARKAAEAAAEVKKAADAADAAKKATDATKAAKGSRGLVGADFERWLHTELKATSGNFKMAGREFDGAVGSRWIEAKSGRYWTDHAQPGAGFEKFKSDIGSKLRIAKDNSASLEVHSNSPISQHVRDWLSKKSVSFFEH